MFVAGLRARALRIGLIGGAIAFALTETIGIAAAVWPEAWLTLFGSDPRLIEAGSAYLRIAGPCYGFFGLGLAVYFSAQGARPLLRPLSSGFLRMLVAVVRGRVPLPQTGSLRSLFAAAAGRPAPFFGAPARSG